MTSFTYHFRPSVRSGRNKGSIFVRVIHCRKAFSMALGLHVYPEEWDSYSRTVTLPYAASGRYLALKDVRRSLEANTHRMERILSTLDVHGSFSIDDIRSRMDTGSGMLSDFVSQVISEISDSQPRTARAYRSMYNSLMEFTSGKDIALSGIDGRLVGDYETFLKEKGLHMNTVSFYMRNFRAVYNRAVRRDLLGARAQNPFKGVYTGVMRTEKKALDTAHVRSLASLDPALFYPASGEPSSLPARLRDSLAMFMFCLLAQGMSFVDMAYLTKDSLCEGMIRYRRKKTGQLIEVTLCREMKNILKYFSGRTATSPFLFPAIKDNGKPARLQYESALRLQNIRLKELFTSAGGSGRITTHSARHSWATIARNEKVDIAVISEALGHSNEKTMRIYLGNFKRRYLDKANEKIRRAIKKAV